jgi:heparinase II/III-like protein
VGFLADIRYFGFAIGPGPGSRLAFLKLQKTLRKRRLARVLAQDEPESQRLRRLGLPENREARVALLRNAWKPLADSTVLRPDAPRETADRVLAGVESLFGQDLAVGWPPRWNWRWDGTENAVLFARDVRSTWELQRLQGILPLAAAAHGSAGEERERYAAAYLEAIDGFQKQHPGPDGIAWASALELGLRLGALTQGLPLVCETAAFLRHEAMLLSLLDRQARWLAADLSLDKVVRGNHLLGELAGLLAVGHLVPSARTTWWGTLPVRSLLETEILRQFHEDGVSVEQSLTYEKFVLEFLTLAGEAARRRDDPFEAEAAARLCAAAAHLEAATAPDGTLPRVGDCDSGRGAFDAEDPHRPRNAIARARRVFARAPSGSRPPMERAWFETGGHVVLHPVPGNFLFVRGGPFGWGIPGPAAHSHADWFAPVVYLDGEAVLIDPGVFGYDVGAELRDAYRSWEAHCGFVPGPEQGPRPAGLFRWRRWNGRAEIQALPESAGAAGWVRWNDGPLLWHRSISYNQLRRGWTIKDRLEGRRPSSVRWSFHLAPGTEALPSEPFGSFRLTLRSGKVVELRFDPPGENQIQEGWMAPAYGRREPCLVVVHAVPPDVDEAVAELFPA